MPATRTRRRTWSRSGKRIDLGGCLAPDEAFLFHRGPQTPELRVRRQSTTAAVLAEKLARSPLGAAGALPGTGHTPAARHCLPDVPRRTVRQPHHGGRPWWAGRRNALLRRAWHRTDRVFVGKCVLQGQPRASTTHRQLDDTALAAAGIARGRFGCRWVWRIQRICWQICVKHSTPSDVCSGPESPWAQDRLRPGKSNAECAPANSGLVGGAAEEITCRGVPTH
jgi:hypothetical protein